MSQETLIQFIIIPFILIFIVLNICAVGIAYLVLLERKVMAFIQSRLGPMRVGPHGLLQPAADGLKLLLKEDIQPAGITRAIFIAAPIIVVVTAFAAMSLIPFGESFTAFGYEVKLRITDVNIGLLMILAISSLSTYGVVLGGWSSASKYPLLGALRAAAQMVSYEVALTFAVLAPIMVAGTLSMVRIVEAQMEMGYWLIFLQPVAFLLFLITMIAETNRPPFDMVEADSELVGGFFTEYSGMRWSLFFLGEYGAMIVMAAVNTTIFLGGWLRPFPNVEALAFLDFIPGPIWFAVKLLAFLYFYIWVRFTFPRYRYDQLMTLGWKVFIPISIANVLLTGLVMLLLA